MASIRIEGMAELQRKLERLSNTEIIRRPMKKALRHVADQMAEYPPARRGVRRTQALKKGWQQAKPKTRKTAQGIVGAITNKRYYWQWVQGPRQHDSNKGRWKTDKEIVRRENKAILKFFTDELDKALGE